MEFSSDLDNQPHKIVEVTAPHSRPLWKKILFFVVLIAFGTLIIFGISTLLSKKETTSTKKTSEESKKESTPSAKISTERCSPKQDLDNNKQGYQACFEPGWKEKEIKVSGLE